jgi:site-specific DNA-methyltransferase (adenine-specific)
MGARKRQGVKFKLENNSEDIWFCTASNKYKFNAERVKLARRVIAPYKDENGRPKIGIKTKTVTLD